MQQEIETENERQGPTERETDIETKRSREKVGMLTSPKRMKRKEKIFTPH